MGDTTWQPIDPYNLTEDQRLILGQIWRRGDLSGFLHPGQLRIRDAINASDSKLHVVNVSRQFGKSMLSCYMAIEAALGGPGRLILYCAPTRSAAKDIVYPRMEQILATCPSDMIPHKSGDTWKFKNGSAIRLLGVETKGGDNVRGGTYWGVFMDECRNMLKLEDLVEGIIKPTTIATRKLSKAAGRIIMISTPPDTPAHAFTARYIHDAIKGQYYYHATHVDNPFRDEKEIEEAKDLHGEFSQLFKREYLADYTAVDADVKVIKYWNAEENDLWIRDWTPKHEMRPYVGMDLGARDYTAMVFGLYDWWEGTLVIVDEHLMTNPTTVDIAKAINDKERKWFQACTVQPIRVCDIDLRFFGDMRKDHHLSIEPVRKINDDAMINQLDTHLLKGKVRIHPRCEQLRFQLATGVWNKNRTDYVRTQRSGHLDAIDALKYLIRRVEWKETLQGREELPMDDGLIRIKSPWVRSPSQGPFDSIYEAFKQDNGLI